MRRASRHVAGKSPFIQILLKISSKKVMDSSGRCLSIRLWIASIPLQLQVLWQNLRADVSYKTLWMIGRRLSGFVQLSI